MSVKPVSKGFYLGSIFGSLALAFLILIASYALILGARDDEAVIAGGGLACISYLPMIDWDVEPWNSAKSEDDRLDGSTYREKYCKVRPPNDGRKCDRILRPGEAGVST